MRTVKLPSYWLRRICRLLLLCLAFQNVAVAAHACPVQTMPAAGAGASLRHCLDGKAAANTAITDSAVCAQHCAPERATGAGHADLQVPLAWLPELPPMTVADRQPWPPACRATAAVTPPPPIRTRYCSLLI